MTMIERHPVFWQGALRTLYPFAADDLITACKRNPNAVVDFLKNDLDREFDDPKRKADVKALLASMASHERKPSI